jgi:2'-5' RNA ligase
MNLRLFVAVDLEGAVRRRVAEFETRVRRLAPAGRWVAAAQLHITLKFIGSIAASALPDIRRALAGITHREPITLTFRHWGFFPSASRPRVFWIGVEDAPHDALRDLAEEIEARMERLGIAREERPFHAHLTLARFGSPGDAARLRTALAGWPAEEFGAQTVRSFLLYQSVLKPSGSEYIQLEHFVFAPEDP